MAYYRILRVVLMFSEWISPFFFVLLNTGTYFGVELGWCGWGQVRLTPVA